MDDQLEEREVLDEMGTWNSEYDIAEEEEERLLEEHELTQGKDEILYESEANFSDTEFDAPEIEEDILDLGLNEDIIEYEEVNTIQDSSSSEAKKKSSPPQQGSEMSTTGQSSLAHEHSPMQNYRRGGMKSGQPGSSFKHSNFKRQPNFPIPLQMRNPPPRMGPPGFHNQRPLFDGPNRPLIGRSPSIMGYHGVRNNFPRHPLAMGCEPLFVQDFHHGLRLPAQRFPRHPFKEHHAVDHHQLVDFDRNNSANRLFINPHYQGSVTVQNGCTNRITPLSEPRLNFSPCDNAPPRIAFQNRQLRPPPGPNLVNVPRSVSFSSMRFAPPIQPSLPPPRVSGPSDQMSPTRFKPPQNLMDMVLPTPFGDGPLRPQYHPEPQRPQRFRFNSFEPPSHSYSDSSQPVRFLTSPPIGSKRPATNEVITAPLKQLRLGPTGNIQISRTFPPPASSLSSSLPSFGTSVMPSTSSSLRLGPPPGVRPQNHPPPFGKPQQMTDSPRFTSNTTTSVLTTTTSPFAVPPPIVSQPPSASASTSNSSTNTEDASPEMKEYLEKMEEQRKKREEVIKMKEERRRQKLESAMGKDDLITEAIPTQAARTPTGNPPNIVSQMSRIPDMSKTNMGVMASQSPFSRLDGDPSRTQAGFAVKENNVSTTLRKTVLVKPTTTVPARVVPQAAVGVNRRYKIIIVKNKSGKILEKRRVPIDEPLAGSQDNPTSCHVAHVSPISSFVGQNPARISETVTIENLSMNATEEYVWKLCRMFGTVQEVYPKLQEGKAIVRFSSSSGAYNFLSNHNAPGICVRFL